LAVIVVIDSVPDATDEFPPAVPLLPDEPPPPPPPPTTVTLTRVIPVGIVKVPLEAKTCPFPPVADNGATAEVQAEPLLTKTLPLEPGATNLTGFVPSPISTFSAVRADTPVPPSATTRSVIPVIVPPLTVGLVSVLLVRVAVAVRSAAIAAVSAAVTKAVVAS
jgi:hypothetical protein